MKPKLGISFIIVALLFTQLNKLFSSIVGIDNRFYEATIITVLFILISILVFFERRSLDSFHLDRLSLLIFVFASVVRIRFGIEGDIWFLSIIGITGIACAFILIKNWSTIPKTNFYWLSIGILIGIFLAIPLSILQIMSGYLSLFEYKGSSLLPVTILINRILYSLSFSSTLEEILLRGFLWGYLVKFGCNEKRIFWFQTIFFWLLHWNRIVFPLIFFIGLPLMSYILNKLRFNSKQVLPSLIAHTVINALVDSSMIILSRLI